jgi:hypothetical protein
MCSGLINAGAVMDASSKIWLDMGWNNADDVVHSVLACKLLDALPGILSITTSELDQLTFENYHTDREVIESLQKEFEDFKKFEKENEFKKFRKC